MMLWAMTQSLLRDQAGVVTGWARVALIVAFVVAAAAIGILLGMLGFSANDAP